MCEDYTGNDRRCGERRKGPEMYTLICEKKFLEIYNQFTKVGQEFHSLRQEEISPIRSDVSEIKKKVFNGLSELPKKINLLIILFITILAGIGGLFWRQGQLSAMINIHLDRDNAVYEASE